MEKVVSRKRKIYPVNYKLNKKLKVNKRVEEYIDLTIDDDEEAVTPTIGKLPVTVITTALISETTTANTISTTSSKGAIGKHMLIFIFAALHYFSLELITNFSYRFSWNGTVHWR